MATRKESEEKSKERRGPSLLEWVSAAVGAAIALAIVAFIAFEALRSSSGAPPLLEVRAVGLTSQGASHVVEVEVANRSSQTAAAVAIEGELKQGGESVETSSATIAYVPGNSERHAGLIFTRDPRRYSLTLRATGYEKP